MIAKRRREDDEDDASTFLPSVPRDATQPEEAQEEELDEFGRAVPRPIPSSRRADRVARRSQRQRSTRRPQEEEEGYSTDSSLPPPTATAYKTALSRLSSSAHALLSDVRAPEFRDPAKEGGLATWWGRWRRDWEESYVGAWGGLGLVGAWEFWVREEVCGWDCVEVSMVAIAQSFLPPVLCSVILRSFGCRCHLLPPVPCQCRTRSESGASNHFSSPLSFTLQSLNSR